MHADIEQPETRSATAPAIGVLLKGYPRLSETFIAQELLGLQRSGVAFMLISMRQPTDAKRHPIHAQIEADVLYLPEYLHEEIWRVAKAWWRARRLGQYREARRLWLKDLWRDRTRNRVRRFGQAMVLAAELPVSVHQLYAHFVHTPASVARYTSVLRGIPWSCSAHAKDVWTTPQWELQDKLQDCRWLVTCTSANRDYLAGISPDHRNRIELLYHGLDFSRFPDPGPRRANRNRGSNSPVTLLSVGRAVPKKGYDDLLRALAGIPAEICWRLIHVGGGAQLDELQALAHRLGLESRIDWLGSRAQTEVLECYRRADIFVLPCRISPDGDRDGLPNVLMEAQSQRLPCISTTISGIPELMRHNETGLLVAPEQPDELRNAIMHLVRQPAERVRLGEAGFQKVRSDFTQQRGLRRLVSKLAL